MPSSLFFEYPPPEGSNTKQLSSKLECEKQAHSSSRINAIVELFLGNHTFIKIWLPVSVCWLVYLLLVWPGIWGADSIFQTQYLITGDKIWAHHPILHTLWLSLPMQISNALVGDYSPGFAFYTISQILATSAAMALILKRIRRWSIPQPIWIALFVTVCLFPGFATWSTMATKDILFAALFGLCIELIVDFWVLYPRCHIKPSKNDIILLLISFVLMLLLRNNAIYAFVLFSIPLVILSSKKWPAIIFSIALVLGCLGVNTALSLTLETKPGGQAEMMSVPACQLARVANNVSNLTEEDARFIEDYVPSWRSYNESIADSVKNSFDMQRVKESPLGFLSGYLSIGLKYPDTFTDAFLKLSLGFWSPITNNNPYCPTGMWAPGENLPETDYIFIKHKEIIPGSLEAVNSLTKARYRQESCALFRQPHKPAVRCGYPSSRVTSR